ncbi:hypothetical protein T484DRAFT_1794845 [Baffinella frigidus]|nr:hypothetical protein T484DRAFT_1794845 [Cryptophyta sp. CCMP2293]
MCDLAWPQGLHRAPDRYSGFLASFTLPSVPAPDDAGAVVLNVTGILDPPDSFVSAVFSKVDSAGVFGPGYKAVQSAGSQRDLEATGEGWELLSAADLFTGAMNDGAARVSKASIVAARAASGTSIPLSILARGNPSESSHTDSLSLHDAGIVFPPEKCVVKTVTKGPGGLKEHALLREEEICLEVWQCDSVGPSNNRRFNVWQCDSVGPSNNRRFNVKEFCEKECRTQWTPKQGSLALLGASVCTSGGTSTGGDGTCKCIPEASCSRTLVHPSPHHVNYT